MPPLTLALIAAISVFLLGNLCRVVKAMLMPVHLRWDLYPIPKGPRDRQRYGGSYFEETEWWTKPIDTGLGGEVAFMLKEVFLLRGVFKTFALCGSGRCCCTGGSTFTWSQPPRPLPSPRSALILFSNERFC